MESYFKNVQDVQFTGGTLYEIDAIKALKKDYDISQNVHYVKNENFLMYFLKNHQKTIDADICFTDPYVLAFSKLDYNKYNIAIIHHIDESIAKQSFLGKLFLKQLLKNLKKVDQVVVVSQYWKSYLEKKDIKHIEIIYNSYPLNDFKFETSEINILKNKLNLDPNKPTIYLGKLGARKGVDDILKHIDTSKYNLITTGKSTVSNDIVKNFYLSKNEFPILLKIADVVLAMSTMPEGWNRIAHEALLVKTPVIGSGTGGMRELLERSGQKIVEDYSSLDQEIETCINYKNQLGNLGYDFVKQFDMNYFESKWLELMSQIKTKINF
jgi:glycosyltransferase involved in cell wall biosynthesis